MTTLLKHQVKKVVGDETLNIIAQEAVALGSDKVDEQIKSWLGAETNAEQLEKAAASASEALRGKINDAEIEQWMVMLPIDDLPKVVEAIEKLPSSPDELITERCGYVLQGADVNLFLAQYALEQEQDKAKAKGYAEEAKKLATCDGPPYYYKVAMRKRRECLKG